MQLETMKTHLPLVIPLCNWMTTRTEIPQESLSNYLGLITFEKSPVSFRQQFSGKEQGKANLGNFSVPCEKKQDSQRS